MSLSGKEKFSYGLGAVGKDMVYMLSASYILYYYQDILGVNAVAMGIILLVARVFDAFNDPFMGVIVAKTRTRWGKFRPWLMIGTVTNAVVLFLMFSAPPALDGSGLVAYAAVTYILWGVTYTMMDIPFWSMIPAFTHSGKEREGLSTLGRSCAGVGSAIITVITMLCVNALGGGEERVGFSRFTLIIAVLFVIFIAITCINITHGNPGNSSKLGILHNGLSCGKDSFGIGISLRGTNIAQHVQNYFLRCRKSKWIWIADIQLQNLHSIFFHSGSFIHNRSAHIVQHVVKL